MPDIIPVNANVHYKCAFDISSETVPKPMTHLRQKFRLWCIQRVGVNDEMLHRSWFYIGNPRTEPQYVVNGHQIRTVMAPSVDPDEPSSWALELIHADSDERARRWSVEITLKKLESGGIRFTTINKHWMIPYFIGEYPDPPSPSAPRYVRSLLSDSQLVCKRGDATMSQNWLTVSNVEARSVFDSILSENRLSPLVLVAADRDTGQALIDPAKIMRAVLGNANVFYLSSAAVLDEMNYYLSDDLRVESGMIRVFVPGVTLGSPHNARLHRFLTRQTIDEQGEDQIVRFITNGLSRNGMTFRLNDLTSFQHIFTERRKHTIKSLAAQKDSAAEESQIVWEDNEQLSERASEWETLAVQFEAENVQLLQEVRDLRYRTEETDRVRLQIEDLESQASGIKSLAELPTTISDVLRTIVKLFPKRIVLADGAVESADDYSTEHGGHWGKQEQVAIAWKMAFDLATKLHSAIFVEKASDFEGHFNAQSTFELSMKEGRQTNRDKRLTELRKISHEGKQYDITPHLKYGTKPPKLLRLYFAIDNQQKRFLVGKFGDHIENYSSGKR